MSAPGHKRNLLPASVLASLWRLLLAAVDDSILKLRQHLRAADMKQQREPSPSSFAPRKRLCWWRRPSERDGADYSQLNTKSQKGLATPTSGFFSLPYKIRCSIYSHILLVNRCIDAACDAGKALETLLYLGILAVSKRIYKEALPIFLNENIWIRFRVHDLAITKHKRGCLYAFRDGGHYDQPGIPVKGGFAEKVLNRLTLRLAITSGPPAEEDMRKSRVLFDGDKALCV